MSTFGQRNNTVQFYTALAVSGDGGLTFTKPMLGLVDLGDGGKNNVIWQVMPMQRVAVAARGSAARALLIVSGAGRCVARVGRVLQRSV